VQLSQIQIVYVADQDRILFRANGQGDEGSTELRSWLTRRLVQQLWPGLIQALASAALRGRPGAQPAARDMLIGMQREEYLQNGNFSTPFRSPPPDSGTSAFPLGQEPILVNDCELAIRPKGQWRLSLRPAQGQGMEINMTPTLLHAFCKLLKHACDTAEWGIRLHLPGDPPAPPEETASPRLLN
jgi:hypothetical protein